MEALIAVVGFLGAGKTTLLRQLVASYVEAGWNPFVILNDYENADYDAQQLAELYEPQWVRPLSGSCICCSGIAELRELVNRVPERDKGITLIEANGTTDACALMGFLGVGIEERFLPPVQISVVDVRHWQQRGEHNELEASQIQMSSLIILTHVIGAAHERIDQVSAAIRAFNSTAKIIFDGALDISLLPELSPSENVIQHLEHHKAHWSSCSVDLPPLPDLACIEFICAGLSKQIVRVKGCTRIGQDEGYTYFERGPDGEVHIRPFRGTPVTGSKLLTVGPGSEPVFLNQLIVASMARKSND